MPSVVSCEHHLVERAQSGDSQAMEQLLSKFEMRVYRFGRSQPTSAKRSSCATRRPVRRSNVISRAASGARRPVNHSSALCRCAARFQVCRVTLKRDATLTPSAWKNFMEPATIFRRSWGAWWRLRASNHGSGFIRVLAAPQRAACCLSMAAIPSNTDASAAATSGFASSTNRPSAMRCIETPAMKSMRCSFWGST